MCVQLKAGYGKVDITPAYSTPLDGYGNEEKRMHTRVLDPIYAICVAVSDGEKTLLLYHLDLVSVYSHNMESLIPAIEKKYGICEDAVLFNGTHTHSAPALNTQLDCIKEYNKELCEKLVKVAGIAIDDLSDCTVKIGAGEVLGWNYVRRYLLSDGSYGGDNFGDFKNNTILDHETEADHTMQAVRLVRVGKKDIVLVNWQGHPHRTGGSKKFDLSSDLIEHFRNTVEEEHNVLFAFYQGCGGNINHDSRMVPAEKRPGHVEVGKGLAAGLGPILKNMRPVKSGKIKTAITTFTGKVNHSWDDRVEDAKKIIDFWKNCDVQGEPTKYARSLGFNSVYHAVYVEERAQMPETYSYKIGAVSFGDVCFVWTPNEPYDTTGMYLKDTSPFEMTFVLGYTNGTEAYMPTIKAFQHGGYGCDTCPFPAGVTEKMTNEMLKQILAVKE